MEDDDLTIDFDEPIALFPLPTCVLLPHATIPLHIFEQRYRQMVAEAIEGSTLIAMAVFSGDAWKEDYAGSPPLRRHVCVGRVVRHDKLVDGRYNILLQGLCRARIRGEVESTPFRSARLMPTETEQPMEIDLTEHRSRIDGLLRHERLRELSSINAIHEWLTDEVPTPALVDLATMAICESSEQRYELLAQPELSIRTDWLERRLRDTLRTLEIAHRYRPRDEDEVKLN